MRPSVALSFAILLPLIVLPQVRPVPPPGVPVSASDRVELQRGLDQLASAIEALRSQKPVPADLLPDVLIFHRAVDVALRHNEFFKADEVAKARELLRQGQERVNALARGEAPWTRATGLVVRGYVSRIDESVQPYALVVPPTFRTDSPHRWRLDTWFHGRAETLNEVNFLTDRQKSAGEFTPANAIVLHLYGRYCNANKFAGEIDLFEAMEAVGRHYLIDDNRIVVRGFSMGGAATWHIAAHHAGLWAAAAPGAGFAETAEYLRLTPDQLAATPAWQKALWHLYDATDYAGNLLHCPTVAYSGEIDRQKQAADVMARAMAAEGMRLKHVIGPNTAHKYHPDAKADISRRIDAIADRGRDPHPRRIRFTTWTLAYPRMNWVTLQGLERHWERARITAEVKDGHSVSVTTANVTAFTLDMPPGSPLLERSGEVALTVDGKVQTVSGPMSDGSWTLHLRREAGGWRVHERPHPEGLAKRPGLQGPVDDAFLSRFVMVRPTGDPMLPGLSAWVTSEQQRAIREWRRQFRGDALVWDDLEIDDAEIARSNLVLWGDPGSNKVLARIADRLPIRWTRDGIEVAGQRYPATHALVLIYPNPLNPQRYVVLNSGVTWREADILTNARQVPKLPDWAVIDTTVPPDEHAPGRIAAAGFFDEKWELTTVGKP